ncbi:hypothetical protein [Azospirillum sp.]|uniref:hypothetical protein n=1 Tax=Azospirillum sp. TaxID=34012 RepID=UPI003D745AB9
MSSMDWFEERLEQRRSMLARHREIQRERRRKARKVARVALAVTLVVLSILAVGITRKALTVIEHAQGIESQRVS